MAAAPQCGCSCGWTTPFPSIAFYLSKHQLNRYSLGEAQRRATDPSMAPNLAASQHQLIGDMILSGSLKQADMADIAGCSDRAIRRIATNLRLFGTTLHFITASELNRCAMMLALSYYTCHPTRRTLTRSKSSLRS